MKKIGFIGLGIMGRPMALNLINAGYSLKVYDIDATRANELASKGASVAKSAKETASDVDVVITMLPNSPHVQEAVSGKDGVLEGISKGTIFIDMSSIAPLVSQEIAAALSSKGVEMLDAPVSGGEPKAVDGTLAIMVGGEEAVFDQVKELLQVMGSSVTLVGPVGSGNTTKLANQIIVGLNIAAMSEAMVLANKANVNPERVFNAIRGGLAGSTVLDAKMPLVLEGNFKPGFRIELHIKDLMNAIATAHEVGAPVPLTSQVMEIMQNLKAEGKQQDDHGGLIQYYEKLAKTEVRRQK